MFYDDTKYSPAKQSTATPITAVSQRYFSGILYFLFLALFLSTYSIVKQIILIRAR